MSKVYVVIGGHDYEGFRNPDSVWHNKEKALRRKEQLMDIKRYGHGYYDYVDIFETEVSTVFSRMPEMVEL